MSPRQRAFIVRLLKSHPVMSIATVRPDGWPQATTVAFASDGLDLYFACERASQKVRNISRNRKVSATVDRYCENWNKIRGLSLGGSARVVTEPKEVRRALKLLRRKFPAYGEMGESDLEGLAIVRVTPKVVSLLDYGKGFGHTELVRA